MADLDISKIYDDLKMLYEWARVIHDAGIILTKEPHATRTYQKVTITTDLIGDPNKHAKGLPYHVVKKIHVIDNILKTLVEAGANVPNNPFSDLSSEFDYYHEEKTAYASISDDNVYFLPVASYTKTQQPVLQTLNWDKSLATPGDVGPVLKFFPLSRVGSYQGMVLFLLLQKLMLQLTPGEVWMFIMQTDSTYGATYLEELIKQYLKDQGIQEEVLKSMAYIRSLIQYSSLIRWMHQILKRQLMLNMSYKTAIMVLGDWDKLEDFTEAQWTLTITKRLIQLCQMYPPTITDMITDVTYTEYLPGNGIETDLYDFLFSSATGEGFIEVGQTNPLDEVMGEGGKQLKAGVTTTVVTRSVSMTSDGAYCQSSYQSKPVLTQTLLKYLNLFKQTVSSRLNSECGQSDFGTATVDNESVIERSARIPTSNWDDACKLAGMRAIIDQSISGWGVVKDVSQLLTDLSEQFYLNPGVKSASARWDAITNKITKNVNMVTVLYGQCPND